MLNDLDETLKVLLQQDLPRVVERIEADGFDVRFDVPNREFKARLTKPTISLFLYNIQENPRLRGRVWTQTRANGGVATRRPPVRLDCSYMVTAWSNEVEDEHRLLAGVARVLFRNPVIPQEVLQGGLVDEDDITTEVAQPENFKDVVDIWSVLDNDLHPSIRVTLTIPLEVDVEYESPVVLERRFNLQKTMDDGPLLNPQRVTGRVERAGSPVIGALVRADNSSMRTDERGEYILENVTPGPQLVWVQDGDEFHQIEANLPADSILQLPAPADTSEAGSSNST